jgi:hypothetical protein
MLTSDFFGGEFSPFCKKNILEEEYYVLFSLLFEKKSH